MKKKILIPIVILAILIPVGGIFAWRFLSASLNPPLDLDVIPTETVASSSSVTSNQLKQDKRTCGNSGVVKILEIGTASPLEADHPGADSIRLVVVDFDDERAGILALPADLLVNTPDDLVDELGPLSPLNQIYLAAYQTASGNPDHVKTQKATQVLAQTILDEFGFVPDKYITINGDSFIELVDEIGGISITLATAIDATSENYGIFPVGDQILGGEQTLNFVRILYPNGIGPDYFGRFERQNIVIKALFDAVMRPENWDNALDLAKEARKMVVTDLSVNQAGQLVCMVDLVGEEADLLVVTESMVSFDDQGQMIPDIDAIKALISQLEGN